MIKQTATYDDWKVVRHEDNKIEVYMGGELCPKSAPALRVIAEELGMDINPEWRTAQLGANVIKAMLEAGGKREIVADPKTEKEEGMSVLEKFRTDIVVESEDGDLLIDTSFVVDDSERDLLITNLKALIGDAEEWAIVEGLKYNGPDALIEYFEEQPDCIDLASKLIHAAYLSSQGIDRSKNRYQDYVDCQTYYINSNKDDLHYEYETELEF